MVRYENCIFKLRILEAQCGTKYNKSMYEKIKTNQIAETKRKNDIRIPCQKKSWVKYETK